MGGVLVVLNRAPHPCLLKSIGVAEWQEFVNLICTKMNEGFVLIKGVTHMDYEVISATSKEELTEKVNAKLEGNYLLGGFSVSEGVIYQVVYKEGRR